MSTPGFRKGRPGGRTSGAGDAGDGFLSSSLFSQAQILHLMKNEFARSRRHHIPLGCILMQVDRLPQLVDIHGAELRAKVRQAIGQLVREKTRGADLLGATNDDRYLLMLPHTNLAQTHVVAERLHQLFQTLEVTIDGRELALSMSVGITACSDQQTMFFDTLVAQAEAALEDAVAHGGNRVTSFGELPLRADAGAEPHDGERRASERRADGDGGGSR